MTLRELRQYIEQQKGKKALTVQNIIDTERTIKEKERDLRRHEQAREIIRIVALKTQEQISYHISDITSLALEAVYDNPYRLVAEFVQRRGKTECDLVFERDGNRVEDPMDASGGGVVNVAAFALRVASWSMRRPRTRNTLILDEPFKEVSNDLLPRASRMLKEVSDRLNLQIIMVTHSDELIEAADRTFEVTISKGISSVKEQA